VGPAEDLWSRPETRTFEVPALASWLGRETRPCWESLGSANESYNPSLSHSGAICPRLPRWNSLGS
jgi:hypothetical protein